jgi:hypothetical protein
MEKGPERPLRSDQTVLVGCSRPFTPMTVHALDHKTQPLLIARASRTRIRYGSNDIRNHYYCNQKFMGVNKSPNAGLCARL